MIYQVSKSHNLQLLFSSHCDDATLDLFLKLLNAHPIPELPEIKVKYVMNCLFIFVLSFYRLTATLWIVAYILLVNLPPFLSFHSLEMCLPTLTT